jgi:adenine-specific DNA-methyltransferase
MADNIRWGLDNPHPFSQMKTELIWERKHDEYGNRRMVDHCRLRHAASKERDD